jgi:hypothetical protein
MSVQEKNGVSGGILSLKVSETYRLKDTKDRELRRMISQLSERLLYSKGDTQALFASEIKKHIIPALLGKDKKERSTPDALLDLFLQKYAFVKEKRRKKLEERLEAVLEKKEPPSNSSVASAPSEMKELPSNSSVASAPSELPSNSSVTSAPSEMKEPPSNSTATSAPSEKKAPKRIPVEFSDGKFQAIDQSVTAALKNSTSIHSQITKQVAEVGGIWANLRSSQTYVDEQIAQSTDRFKKYPPSYNQSLEALDKIKAEENKIRELKEQIANSVRTAIEWNKKYNDYFLNTLFAQGIMQSGVIQNEMRELEKARAQGYLKWGLTLKPVVLDAENPSKIPSLKENSNELKLIKLIQDNEKFYEQIQDLKDRTRRFVANVAGWRKLLTQDNPDFDADCASSRECDTEYEELAGLCASRLNELASFTSDLGKLEKEIVGGLNSKLSSLDRSKLDLIKATNNLRKQYIKLDNSLYNTNKYSKDFRELSADSKDPYPTLQEKKDPATQEKKG